MAKPQNVLIGKTSGSVGEATFSTWRGIQVLKSKAQNDYSDPTEAQIQNNTKFSVMAAFIKTITFFVLSGFKAAAIKMTDYNAFQKANPLSTVMGGVYPSYFVNPTELVLSKGPKVDIGFEAAEKAADGANSISVTWSASGSEYLDGIVYIGAFSNTTGELLAKSVAANTVENEECVLTATGLGTNIATTTVIAYFVDPVDGKACNSFIVPTGS